MSERQSESELPAVAEVLMSVNGLTEKQARFLTALAECGYNISQASKQSGVTREVHYYGMRHCPDYQKAVSETLPSIGTEAMLALARKGILGDIVFYQGEPLIDPETGDYVRQTDTVAAIFVAKAAGKFSDQNGTNKTERNNGPQVIINMPQQTNQPPVIEVNEAEEDSSQ